MRGLKQNGGLNKKVRAGRIFYRCVDWNRFEFAGYGHYKGRIFYRCVDWNYYTRTFVPVGNGRIFYRCVDWNPFAIPAIAVMWGRIFYRCVDWNPIRTAQKTRNNVASFTDAWIETLKFIITSNKGLSHLLQMRGLKHDRPVVAGNGTVVASFTDAWIETKPKRKAQAHCKSHLLQMRGLKPIGSLFPYPIPLCRIFYRCVDWNRALHSCLLLVSGRIFYRCVDWNIGRDRLDVSEISRIFYRCVDWNRLQMPRVECGSGSHLLQMRGLKRKRNF